MQKGNKLNYKTLSGAPGSAPWNKSRRFLVIREIFATIAVLLHAGPAPGSHFFSVFDPAFIKSNDTHVAIPDFGPVLMVDLTVIFMMISCETIGAARNTLVVIKLIVFEILLGTDIAQTLEVILECVISITNKLALHLLVRQTTWPVVWVGTHWSVRARRKWGSRDN